MRRTYSCGPGHGLDIPEELCYNSRRPSAERPLPGRRKFVAEMLECGWDEDIEDGLTATFMQLTGLDN